LLDTQGPGNSRPNDGPCGEAVLAQHRHSRLWRNRAEFCVSDQVVGELQRVNLNPDPNSFTLPPKQVLNVMTKMTSGTWKNEFLIAQVSNLETSACRKRGFSSHKMKRLSCQWSLINAIDNTLGVMNKNSKIHKSFSKLLMQQGVKTIDDLKTYARHVSPDIGD
jgi:hypothetical protein